MMIAVKQSGFMSPILPKLQMQKRSGRQPPPYKEQVSFNGETGVRAFHNFVMEWHLFDDLLKLLKATPSARQVVVAGTPVLREQLTMYGRYACKHFRTQAETNFHAVYFLSLEGDNAYVGHHHSIYKVAVNALYTIQESND